MANKMVLAVIAMLTAAIITIALFGLAGALPTAMVVAP